MQSSGTSHCRWLLGQLPFPNPNRCDHLPGDDISHGCTKSSAWSMKVSIARTQQNFTPHTCQLTRAKLGNLPNPCNMTWTVNSNNDLADQPLFYFQAPEETTSKEGDSFKPYFIQACSRLSQGPLPAHLRLSQQQMTPSEGRRTARNWSSTRQRLINGAVFIRHQIDHRRSRWC